MYSIEIENLTKKFKEKTAVNNVSLKIKQGAFFFVRYKWSRKNHYNKNAIHFDFTY